jgi:hypothetical protein
MKTANSVSTVRGLFIIESLDRDDERSRRDGFIIKQILCLAGLPVKYHYVRSKTELSNALAKFKQSAFRYLHISCHGS